MELVFIAQDIKNFSMELFSHIRQKNAHLEKLQAFGISNYFTIHPIVYEPTPSLRYLIICFLTKGM
jgi:hypothetical protein